MSLPVNLGLANALNEGLKRVTTPWMTWFSADTVLHPNFTSEFLKVAQRFPEVAVFTSPFNVLKHDQQPHGDDASVSVKRGYLGSFRRALFSFAGCASFFFSTSCVVKVGLFDTRLNGAEDFDFLLRLLMLSPYAVHVSPLRPLFNYTVHGGSMSARLAHTWPQIALQMSRDVIDIDALYPGAKFCVSHSNCLASAAAHFLDSMARPDLGGSAASMASIFLSDSHRCGLLRKYVNASSTCRLSSFAKEMHAWDELKAREEMLLDAYDNSNELSPPKILVYAKKRLQTRALFGVTKYASDLSEVNDADHVNTFAFVIGTTDCEMFLHSRPKYIFTLCLLTEATSSESVIEKADLILTETSDIAEDLLHKSREGWRKIWVLRDELQNRDSLALAQIIRIAMKRRFQHHAIAPRIPS